MNSGVSSERSTPSPPPPPIKRLKSEHDDIILGRYTPSPLPLTAPQGVERILFPTTVNTPSLSYQHVEHLSTERTEILRGQGRRVVGLPMVFGDGIALNWVRYKSGSVVGMQSESHNVGGTAANNTSQKFRFPDVSTGGGCGTSATDAIIIDEDEDTTTVPSHSHGKRSISLGISLNENVTDDSRPDVGSPPRPEHRVEDIPEASYHSPVAPHRGLSSENFSDTMSSPPPNRALTKEHVSVVSSRLCSDGSDMSISDSEDTGTDKEVDGVKDIHGSGIPARQAKLPSPASLQPIRKLIASRKQRGDPVGVLYEGAEVALEASQKQARNDLREEMLAITSSESDEELNCHASDPQVKRVPLPKTVHGRPRRLLMPNSADLPLVAVTMRGDCHFIEREKKFRISGFSLPNPGVFRHVADVCMVGNTAVLGCDKGTHQISFVSVAGKPKMIDVACSPHSNGPRYQDTQKRGVSCLAAIHAKDGHIKFLSGGYDGTIHKWRVGLEMLNRPRSTKVASHGTHIMALAYRDHDRSVAASTGKRLHITDLSRGTTEAYQFSNDIQQIHMHPQAEQLTLFEVKHLSEQVLLYDSRKGFDNEPCLTFGERNTNKFPGQRTRGSAHLVHFVQASEDGCVMLWDYRNAQKAVITARFKQAEKIVHAIFADTDIATFGEGVVTFFEDYLA